MQVHIRVRPSDYDRIYLLARQVYISVPEFIRRTLQRQAFVKSVR